MSELPDDLELEAGLLAGRSRRQQLGHDHKPARTVLHVRCAVCHSEISDVVLGCAGCVLEAVSTYTAHQVAEHWDLLLHAYARFNDGVGRTL